MAQKATAWMAMGAGLGLLAAVISEQFNTGLGIAMGAGIGLALGSVISKKTPDEQSSDASE